MVTEPETETERETETEVGLAKDDLRQEGARPRGGGPLEALNRRIFGPYGHSLPQRANYGSWENFPFPSMDGTEDFQCLGQSNWTICSSLSPFCYDKISTFHFLPGEPILITPEG